MARTDSRDRILDAAERLFAQKGIRATTLREIAVSARANTGSIYFHFKTKGELTREVFRRRLGPLDAERLARLEACECEAAPDPPDPRTILEALIAPLARLTRGGDRGGLHFLGVLGRTYSEPDPEVIRMLERDHGHTLERFRAALACATRLSTKSVRDVPSSAISSEIGQSSFQPTPAWRTLRSSVPRARSVASPYQRKRTFSRSEMPARLSSKARPSCVSRYTLCTRRDG